MAVRGGYRLLESVKATVYRDHMSWHIYVSSSAVVLNLYETAAQ
jgi:hypothetical protein